MGKGKGPGMHIESDATKKKKNSKQHNSSRQQGVIEKHLQHKQQQKQAQWCLTYQHTR
jgi:hypothetical protein